MHVAKIPNRNSAPTYLLRETYREGGKVKYRTLDNITSLGSEKIARISQILKGILSEVTADDYSNERFVVCHNNLLLEKRVRDHFFICMLSYYVVRHLRRVRAAYLFGDENLDETRTNHNPVVTATPNKKTTAKKARNAKIKIKITSNENDTEIESGEHRVESFQTILSHLATICRNDCR
ncbi:MAG: hypothetical protein LBE18_07825, partial [Planctomycetaceae bacterium]|nr:hypothetical protein [Planctomycetaceae bacterium]